MCGPTGSGAFYIREGLDRLLEPTFIGGGSIRDVSSANYELAEGWRRFEAGTPAIAEGIGLGAAVDYLEVIGIESIHSAMKSYGEQLYKGLVAIPDVEVYGPREQSKRVALASFNIKGFDSHDVALTLDISKNIMIRSGHHCALPTMRDILGVKGTARASLYIYNTPEEIELLLSGIEDIRNSH
jgi:cysteine desulfurase/selenocysteine lyase